MQRFDLWPQFLRLFLAIGLVLGVHFVTKRWPLAVHHECDALRPILDVCLEHVDHTMDRTSVLALAGLERGHRMVRTVRIPSSIYNDQSPTLLIRLHAIAFLNGQPIVITRAYSLEYGICILRAQSFKHSETLLWVYIRVERRLTEFNLGNTHLQLEGV